MKVLEALRQHQAILAEAAITMRAGESDDDVDSVEEVLGSAAHA